MTNSVSMHVADTDTKCVGQPFKLAGEIFLSDAYCESTYRWVRSVLSSASANIPDEDGRTASASPLFAQVLWIEGPSSSPAKWQCLLVSIKSGVQKFTVMIGRTRPDRRLRSPAGDKIGGNN